MINYKQSKHMYSFCLYNLFVVILVVFLCIFYLIVGVLYYYISHIYYYFYSLLFVTSFFKFVLKYIARKIDIDNMNCTYNYNCNSSQRRWYNYVSMEMFVEFLFIFTYFINYYELFIFELSKAHIIDTILLIFQHLLSESIQSILQFSTVYFDATKTLHSKLQLYYNNSDHNSSNKNHCRSKMYQQFLVLLLKIVENDGNVNEWRIRHSIDCVIRFIVLVSSFVFFGVILVVLPYQVFNVSNKDQFYNGIFYVCLSFSCDLIYFVCIFLFYYMNNHFNIWKPFALIYNFNWSIVCCLFCLSFAFAVIW